MTHLGVDLSVYRGAKDLPLRHWDALAARGVAFAISRASIGSLPDASFGPNRERATARGMVVGAYHFLVHRDVVAPERQAETFVRAVRDAGGARDCLLVLDVEWGRGDDALTWAEVKAFAGRLRELVPERHAIGLYTAEAYWRALGNPDLRPAFDYLWQARWCCVEAPVNAVDDLPARPPVAGFGGVGGRPPLWQYGRFTYRVAGERKGCDGNAW